MSKHQQKSLFQKAKELPPFKKLLWFLICVVGWFVILYVFAGSEDDSIKAAENTRNYWILSTIAIAGISAVFYGTRLKEDKE